MKDEFFKGDAYFYVDDSVIYIQTKLDAETFNDKIKNLNASLETWCNETEAKESSLCDYISDECMPVIVCGNNNAIIKKEFEKGEDNFYLLKK